MKRKWILILIFFTFTTVLVSLICKQKKIKSEEQAQILLEKVQNIEKLMVVEGTFSEIYTYKDSKNLFHNFFPVEKKVIVIINATVQIGYDLNKVGYSIDAKTKTLQLNHIPKTEIVVSSQVEYYDIDDSRFYKLTANDFTKIQKRANELILQKVKESTMPKQAEQRLNIVLENIIFSAKEMGWKVIKP